jgi:hypothetical protein
MSGVFDFFEFGLLLVIVISLLIRGSSVRVVGV